MSVRPCSPARVVPRAVARALAGAALLLAAAAPRASHAQSPSTFWYWSGNCVDCAAAANTPTYFVSAILELTGYTSGVLNEDQFVSFRYSGSNLVDPFAVMRAADIAALGSPASTYAFNWLNGNPDANRLLLEFGDRQQFDTGRDGDWHLCAVPASVAACDRYVANDYGNQGAFTTTPPSTTVPEPSTYALMAAGLGALLVVRRRRAAA